MKTRTKNALQFDAAQAAKSLTKKETPRDSQTQKRINEIVEIAVGVFAKQGMSHFSMRRIAALSGISLSTLQHHFGNQKNLLVITINSIGSDYMRRLESIGLDRTVPARRRFESATEQLMSWAMDPVLGAAYCELFALATRDKEIAGLVQDIYSTFYGVLAELVAEINPKLSSTRARTVGVLIGTQLDGLMLFHRHGAGMQLPVARVISAMKANWVEEMDRP